MLYYEKSVNDEGIKRNYIKDEYGVLKKKEFLRRRLTSLKSGK